jgi:hypothetical protein
MFRLTLKSLKNINVTRFFVVAPCSLSATALMMEAVSTCETSVNFYETTRLSNPEESHLHASQLEPEMSLKVILGSHWITAL